MFSVWVVWCVDGPVMFTELEYEDTDAQRQCMLAWSANDYVNQAADVEEIDMSDLPHGYELTAIFEGDLTFKLGD